MNTLRLALSGARKPGVYRFTGRSQPSTIRNEVERLGWRFFHLDGRAIADKRSFLAAGAAAMDFPNHFGRNWDALEDMLNDLSWAPAPGYVVLYDDAGRLATASPGDWETALSIFRDTVERWQKDGVPVFVLLRRVGRGIDLPEL